MIDNGLMALLLSAINPNETKLLLIGDSNQLPSIAPGNVLHDLIACRMIPCVELDKVFRHSGSIVQLCAAIRTNDKIYVIPKHPVKKLDLENGDNYIHIETGSVEAIKKTIIKLATISIPNKYGFNIDNGDIQVLSPVNSKTILSCDSLNTAIQDIINPQPVENCIENKNGNGVSFRLNSKIINVKNTYDAIDIEGNKQIILNGDLGKITKLDENGNKMVVTFQNPERKIILNKWKNDLKLSYVLTCHKSQGSQWNVIILPVHSTFQYSFSRALLYTAISRSKTLLFTVGTRSAISQARRDISVYQRQTFLASKIQDRMLENL
jgi:exodeoxyribonuclease V alpha subunit